MFEMIDASFPWQLFVGLTSLSSGILRRSNILKLLSQQSLCKYVSSGHETTRSLCLFFSTIPAPGHFRRRITSVSSTVVRDRARGLASLTPPSAGSLSEFDWCFSNMSFFRTSRSIPFLICSANLDFCHCMLQSLFVTITTVVYFTENICAVSLLRLTEPLADIYVSMQGVGVHWFLWFIIRFQLHSKKRR